MRLTIDTIQLGDQIVDPNNDRAIVLRGMKIPVIENLGVTKDQYGCIDLSDNDITRLGNVPKLVRLKTLLLANNAISSIASDAFDALPELVSLVLSRNRISALATLLPVANLRRLERLSLIDNPVTQQPHYRAFVIHLRKYSREFRFLDFQRITDAERSAAETFFKSAEGLALLGRIKPEKDVAEPVVVGEEAVERRPVALTPEILEKIKLALTEAADMETMNKLEKALKTGDISPEVSALIGV